MSILYARAYNCLPLTNNSTNIIPCIIYNFNSMQQYNLHVKNLFFGENSLVSIADVAESKLLAFSLLGGKVDQFQSYEIFIFNNATLEKQFN